MDNVKGASTVEERDELGARLTSWIDAAVSAVTSHKERCEVNEKLYRMQPYERAYKPFDGACSISLPLMKPKVDMVVAGVCGSIARQAPYFSYKTYGSAINDRDAVEDATQWWIRHSDFDRRLKTHALMTALNGRAVYRMTFVTQADGYHSGQPSAYIPEDAAKETQVSYCGINVDVIHLHNMAVYPVEVPEITRARLVGHRDYFRRAEILEQIEAGAYFEDANDPPTDDRDEKAAGRDPEWDGVTSASADQPEDDVVEVWSCIVKLDLNEDKIEEYYEVELIYSTGKILSIRPYRFNRPWYFAPAFHFEYDKFYYAGSLAQDLQGLQLLQNELVGMMVDGILHMAFPTTFVNARGGYTEDQFIDARPGRVYPINGALEVQQIGTKFEAQYIPPMLGLIGSMADAVARVPGTDSFQETRPGTTAREVAALQAAAAVSSNDYLLTYAGNELCDMADFARVLMRENFDMIKSVWGDAFPVEHPDQLRPGGVFEVSGKTPTETPEARMAAAEKLMMVKAQTGTPSIDAEALIESMVEDSGVSNPDQVYVSAEEIAANGGFGIEGMGDAGVPGMGGVPQVPGGQGF